MHCLLWTKTAKADWMTDCQTDRLSVWLIDWCDLLTVWLTDSWLLTNEPTNKRTNKQTQCSRILEKLVVSQSVKKFSQIFQNVYHHVHNKLWIVSLLSQLYVAHAIPFYSCKRHFMLSSSKWLSLQQNPECFSHHPVARNFYHSSCTSLFDHQNNIWPGLPTRTKVMRKVHNG